MNSRNKNDLKLLIVKNKINFELRKTRNGMKTFQLSRSGNTNKIICKYSHITPELSISMVEILIFKQLIIVATQILNKLPLNF